MNAVRPKVSLPEVVLVLLLVALLGWGATCVLTPVAAPQDGSPSPAIAR